MTPIDFQHSRRAVGRLARVAAATSLAGLALALPTNALARAAGPSARAAAKRRRRSPGC